MPDLQSEYFVVFETWVAGKLARVEVPATLAALNSRETRKAAEHTARISFTKLDPNFRFEQRIRAVDIVEVKHGEN